MADEPYNSITIINLVYIALISSLDLHLFFQCYSEEIDGLPEVLAEKVSLIPELLTSARATSTTKSYHSRFQWWRSWALCNSVEERDILPAKPFYFSIYLCSLVQTVNTPCPVIQAFYGVKFIHDLFDLKSPTQSTLVKNILEAAKRKLSNPVVKKEPVTIQMLSNMFDKLFTWGCVKNQRTICACLIAYAGFLRSTELLNIRRGDIVINLSHMSIFIESSKTDQYRDGAWILIARTGTKLCPVENLERYLEWASIEEDSNVFIFSRLVAKKNGQYQLRNTDKPVSYTTLRELFIDAFKAHVTDISKYGFHSLRSGGATSAANNGV